MARNENSRDRGILTATDREYLQGEKEYKDRSSELHRRADIRDRVENAIKDISLLLESLSDEDLQKTVEEGRTTIEGDHPTRIGSETVLGQATYNPGEEAKIMDRGVEQGLYDMLLFVYRVMLVEDRIGSDSEMAFSQLLEHAHADAISRHKPNLVIRELEHNVITWDREALASLAETKYERRESLTGWEIGALLATGRVPDEELGEYVRQQVQNASVSEKTDPSDTD